MQSLDYTAHFYLYRTVLLNPFVIFAVVAYLDFLVAFVLLIAALFTQLAPGLFHRWDTDNSLRRTRAYREFASEFLDTLQGLVTLKAFGQSKVWETRLADHAHELFQSTIPFSCLKYLETMKNPISKTFKRMNFIR